MDVVTGGSPCQDLSVGGKRAGLAGERSGLYMEQIRCVKELREADVLRGRTGNAIRPRYMVWENVPGAFSSGNPKGSDFAAVIEELIKIAEPDAVVCVMPPSGGWTKSGCYYDRDGSWSVAWRVHDAQFWGVPQRRKRISLVADFGGLSAPEILFERKGLRGDFAEGGTPWKSTPCDAERSSGADDRAGECVTYAIDHAITTGGNCTAQGPCVHEDIQATLKASGVHAVACAIDRADTAGCNGKGWSDEAWYTLNTINRPAVCYAETYQKTTGPLMANSHPGSYCGQDAYQDMLVTPFAAGGFGKYEEGVGTLRASGRDYGGGTETLVAANVVRRLTPLECERLQGYPDGWTDIGEWVDSKGKRHKDADSPRYKALGNSIALPFWKWLLKRISAQYERDATLGSLFDGIGGFPLCWEQINGKGSALWASEIEEFPMAVTKLRFKEE